MTLQELKEIALNASKNGYDSIYAKMKEAAEKGNFSCEFKNLADGEIHHLKEKGFNITEGPFNRLPMVDEKTYTVSFK